MESRLSATLAGLAWLACVGCGFGGAPCLADGDTAGGSTIWTEQTQELQFDTAGLAALEVRTHNGEIKFDNELTSPDQAGVVVTVKGGGRTQAEADEALRAIKVYNERNPDGTQRLGWKWVGLKQPHWRARVSFEIHAPSNLKFDGETHNGPVKIDHVAGEARIVTHNGQIDVTSRSGKLQVETHNGKINADYDGSDITLITHNGEVVADLSRCGVVKGTIQTHNGDARVIVGDNISADLHCEKHNGSVIFDDVPVGRLESSQRNRVLTGKLGSGGGRLNIATHNGSVRVQKSG
ncbi:MAG: hypothetical protein JSU63_21705 [Phycisphaerales bacterium]|nr:MAG: hypothetical protein JSU63_21705 [Phycisphaerales bacterium]